MKKRKEALQGATDFHYENFLRRSRYTSVFLVLLAAFCVITVLNINTGNVDISIPKILKIIFLREGNKMEYNIIWKIRLPRILMAAILGGALSLSGFLLQTFFENPIAGPFVLGISSGAKMVVALAMIYFLGRFQVVSSYTLIIAAFIGSLIATRFYPSGVQTDQSYGNTFSSRYHDRLYLFSGHGFCGDFCRGLRHCQPARMEPGKLFRYELEQCEGGGSCHRSDDPYYIFHVQADRSLPAGRSLCPEYGCEYSLFQDYVDTDFQCTFCMCDCICRTDFFRGNRCSLSGKEKSWNFPATDRHSCHIFGWRCLLYDV